MNRRDQFLRDQDDLRRRAQKDHARKVDRDARGRQEDYFSKAGERDQRIREDIDRRDAARRNDEYKKSVFFAELQQAKVEGRAPIYGSYLDVPDLVEPEPVSTESPWGPLLTAGAIGVVLACGAVWALFHYFGGLILGLFITVVVAYLAITGIWLYLTKVKPPTTPEEAARAAAWNPVTITGRGIAFARRRHPANAEEATQYPQGGEQDGRTRPPAQPQPEPEPEVYRPQYFDSREERHWPPSQ